MSAYLSENGGGTNIERMAWFGNDTGMNLAIIVELELTAISIPIRR